MSSTTVRDPWLDARRAATQELLDDEVAAARRRLRRRWAARALLTLVLVFGVVLGLGRLVGRSLDDVERLAPLSPWVGWSLFGLGVVLMLVSSVTTVRSGGDGPLVTPDDYLDGQGRRWLRTVLADGTPAPVERHEVVLDAARRAVRGAGRLPQQVGWVLLLGGMLALAPQGPLLVLFPALLVWQVARSVQDQVRARRARRWLALHA